MCDRSVFVKQRNARFEISQKKSENLNLETEFEVFPALFFNNLKCKCDIRATFICKFYFFSYNLMTHSKKKCFYSCRFFLLMDVKKKKLY